MEIQIEDLSNNPLASKLASQSVYYDGFIRIQPYNQIFNIGFKNFVDQIRSFPVNPDDIWMTSFPKSGTTWTQEMVWCIMNGINPEEERTLDERIPFFELTAVMDKVNEDLNKIPNSFDLVSNLKSKPRLIKSHLMYDMLPVEAREKNVKIIHVARNPRDVCVSFYHHVKMFGVYTGTFEEFVELFLNDMAIFYCPPFSSVLSYWDRREQDNIMFITYEDMKKDLTSVIKKAANFLNKELSVDEISALCKHLSFRAMKKNDKVNKSDFKDVFESNNKDSEMGFIRKGVVGDWKNYLNGDMIEKFEEWETRSLEGSDIKFVYE